MQAFLWAIAGNTLFAAVLACGVALASKLLRRRPALVHALWLLVLVKLVTPPLFDASRLVTSLARSEALPPVALQELPRAESAPPSLAEMHALLEMNLASAREEQRLAESQTPWWSAAVALLWVSGSAVFLFLAFYRAARFDLLVATAPHADDKLQDLAREQAELLGLTYIPSIRVVEACISPLAWRTPWRAAVLLPEKLVRELGPDQLRLLLAHELAHLRRGDPLVRWFTLAVLTLHWWNPIVWLAIRQIEAAQEACCDALVLSSSGASPKRYAEMLLATVDFLAGQATPPPALAAGFTSGNSLKGRCEMILSKRPPFALARTTRWMLAALALAILPLSTPLFGQEEEKKPSREELAERIERIEKTLSELKALLADRAQSETKAVKQEKEAAEQEKAKAVAEEAQEFQKKALEAHAARLEDLLKHPRRDIDLGKEIRAKIHDEIKEKIQEELAELHRDLWESGKHSAEEARKVQAKIAEEMRKHAEEVRREAQKHFEKARQIAEEQAREFEKRYNESLGEEIPRLKEHFAKIQQQMQAEAEQLRKRAEDFSKNPEFAEEIEKAKMRMQKLREEMESLHQEQVADAKKRLEQARRLEKDAAEKAKEEKKAGDVDRENRRKQLEKELRKREEKLKAMQREVEQLRRELEGKETPAEEKSPEESQSARSAIEILQEAAEQNAALTNR